MVKKICSCSKNIERGQNIFELADGIGRVWLDLGVVPKTNSK